MDTGFNFNPTLTTEIVKDSPEIVRPVETKTLLDNPSKLVLLPTVPSGVNLGQPTNDLSKSAGEAALLEYFLKQGKSESSAPLYEYKTEQEKRYNNPFLQFTPNTQGSYSTEDVYGKNQGAGEQLLNSVVKFGATTGATFISGFTAIPRQIDAVRKGDVSGALFAHDSAFSETQEWLNGLENKFPNYLTQVEQDRSWIINAFTPTGAANFWGDTILKNAGFTIGSIANAIVVDAGIEYLSGGTATPVTVMLIGKQLSTALKPLKGLFRTISKASSLNKVDDLMGVARVSENLVEGIKNTNRVLNLKKGSQFLATTYFGTQGEAMIEGYHTYIDTKTKLLEKAYQDGKINDESYLKGIEETASHAGKMTAVLNSVVLGVSNMIQFPKIFGFVGGSDLITKVPQSVSKQIAVEIGEKGLFAANQYNKKKAIKDVLRSTLLKGYLSEASEEGSQYFIGHSLHDYYVDKFNNETKKDLVNYMMGAVPETLQQDDFWKEFFIGGLSGVITGSVIPGSEVQTAIKTGLNSNLFTRTTENIQKSLDLINQSVAEITDTHDNFLAKSDSDKKQSSYKSFHRAVSSVAKFGALENLKDSLNDLKSMPLDEYNKTMFRDGVNGLGLKSETEKLSVINQIEKEINLIERDMVEVERNYPTNLFKSDKVKQVIKSKFGIKDEDLASVQERMFSDWKENQTYLIGRLRNTRMNVDNLHNELKLGANNLDTNEYQVLYATVTGLTEDKKGDAFLSYLTYKKRMVDALKTEENYYDELGLPYEKKRVELERKRLEEFVTSIEKESSNKSSQELLGLKEKILLEEFSISQLEEINKKFEELQKEEKIADNSEKELIRNNQSVEESAIEQVNVVAEINKQEESKRPDVEVLENDPLEIKNPTYYKIRELKKDEEVYFDGQKIDVINDGKTIIRTKQGIIFTPDGVFGENGEVYSYDDIEIKTASKEPVKEIVTKQDETSGGRKFFDSFSNETVEKPRIKGLRYKIAGTPYENGFVVYEYLGRNKFRKITINNDGVSLVSKGVTVFKKEYTFNPEVSETDYINTEKDEEFSDSNSNSISKSEDPVEREVLIDPNETDLQAETNVVETETMSKEEKIKVFIENLPQNEFRSVFLQALNNNTLEIRC